MDLSKYIAAQVLARHNISDDLWSIRIRPEAPFPFQPGQYATLALEDGEGVHERPYSIASSPLESDLEFFLELVSHGEVTPRLHRLEVGETLYLRRSAKGLFTLDRRSGHSHHLLVSTVTGVAPYLSMLRTWATDPTWAPAETRFLLIHVGSRGTELGYADQLRQLAERLPQLQLVLSISRPWEDSEWAGETGRAEDLVRKYADAAGFTAANTTAYFCGNPNMIENVKGILKRAGFARSALHEEIYWIPAKTTAAV